MPMNILGKHYSMENPASIYDEEAMTALELAGRTAKAVDDCIKVVNGIPEKIAAAVKDHIDGGDFDRQIDEHTLEITNKLEETERELVDEVNAAKEEFTAEVESTTSTLNTRLDSLLGQVKSGTTSMDAEIIDARIGANEVTYDSLGTGLREQFLLSWKRARNIWRNSPNGGPYLIVDNTAKTITLNPCSVQGIYSWVTITAGSSVSLVGVTGGTLAVALNSKTKTIYIANTSANFENSNDYLLATFLLQYEKVTRIWADANVEKFISVDGVNLSEVFRARLGANGVQYDSLDIALREQFNLSWKRSRNIWRNSDNSGSPHVIVDTDAKTITVKKGGYQGLYSYITTKKDIVYSYAERNTGTHCVVLSSDGTEVYMKLTDYPFNNPNDYLLCHYYIGSTANYMRMWADANVEKHIRVNERLLSDINKVGDANDYRNKHTANIFKKVVCIGDSITSGHMKNFFTGAQVTSNEAYAYPHYMSKLSGGNTYVNCGVSGATVQSWQNSDGYTKAVNAGQTQAYIIRLLGNDARKGMEVGTIADINSDTATTYIGGYGQIIRKMKAISPNAKFFICTDPRSDAIYQPFNDAVKLVANYFDNVYCLDLLENHALFAAPSFTGDYEGLHYTATGYEQMAEIYYSLICEYINNHPTDFQTVPFIPYD